MNRPFPRSYWVSPSLLAGFLPASKNSDVMQERLTALLDLGVNCFINLMEPDERDYDGNLFVQYHPVLCSLAAVRCIDIQYHNISIRDQDVPSIEKMREILDTIEQSVQQGSIVYVHCWGGKGRTGTVVACWLMESWGLTADDALIKIQELRKNDPKRNDPSPETLGQIEFVRQWKTS